MNESTAGQSAPRPAVAADPHVVLVVDRDAVIRRRPVVVPGSRPAPRLHEVAGRIELEHRRRRHAALAERRILRRADLVARVERVVAVDDEHVIVRVHAHADDVAEHPVIGQRLGPERIDLERAAPARATRAPTRRARADRRRARRSPRRAARRRRPCARGVTSSLPAAARARLRFARCHGADALVVELLHALALVRLDRVEVALRVGRDAVHGVELTGLPAAVAEARQLVERLAVEDVDLRRSTPSAT